MPFLKGKSILESRCRNLENLAKKNGLRHAIITPPKDKYVGEWKNNIKEGKGYFLSRTGKLYEGDWERNFRHGYGVLALQKDDCVFSLQYRGEWKNGKMHGFGARHYPDGSYYVGNWKNGKRHGYGQMWYADGSFYDGFWVKDRRDGSGMFVRSDGNRYEGEWLKDLKHGKGRFFHLDSGQMQDGFWNKNICILSEMIDIPFRQTALKPTPYPILPVELEDHKTIYRKREKSLKQGELFSCTSVRMWI